MKGIVFDIRRFCVHDGPGIRTTVFLKGCPLRCIWCHNPESQEIKIETIQKVHSFEGKKIAKNEQIGKNISVDEVMKSILKDQVFYSESNGGVTFSGGEPLSQPNFLQELLQLSKSNGLHTTVDTCGYSETAHFEAILPFTDLFLYDLKHPDPQIHKKFTGADNRLILQNLKWLSAQNTKIIIRIPVVPGFNDSEKVMNQTADLLKELAKNLLEINLLPYHEMAKKKYERLGKPFALLPSVKVKNENLTIFKELFENQGFKTKIGG
ncbi:MAG TPA: glycyl-radical enzyme activating protein [Bacteroidales bacterium]|nr:glycyl-radical enzyme activating protein [Bacteroidales bacterium]HPR57779.1 glycyl-radical enzyme activating protein [Bacteroidales bacterium]HRW95982.1 glycyl-radical enzyme activating protein [Bacteroidales bacterium]